MVDYHAVGVLSHCYLELSAFVASFQDFTIPLVKHLVDLKVGHWDETIRLLTAQALRRLTSIAPEYFREHVLPALLQKANGNLLND